MLSTFTLSTCSNDILQKIILSLNTYAELLQHNKNKILWEDNIALAKICHKSCNNDNVTKCC